MKILFAVLLSWCAWLPMSIAAQTTQDLLTIPGLADAAASALKDTKAVGLVDMNGNLGGGAYLPVRTLQGSTGIKYLSVGIAGVTKQSDHWRARGASLMNLTDSFRALERHWGWYEAHVAKTALPTVWFGPQLQIPMPSDHFQFKQIRDYLGFMMAVGF